MSEQKIPPLDYHNPKRPVAPTATARRVVVWTIGALVAFALLVSILMPTSLGRAREPANRVKCASNLKQIGQAMFLYANENAGAMVPDAPTLLATQDLLPEVFICPSSALDRASGSTPQQVGQSLLDGDHLSYVLVVGPEKLSNSLDEVLAFDLDNHMPKDSARTIGMNVLLGDGTVRFIDETTAKAIRARYYAGVRPIRLSECSPASSSTSISSRTTQP